MKNNNLFWVSFSDIMLGLFFVMLVLFVVSSALFMAERGTVNILREQQEEIERIDNALRAFDEEFFEFDEVNKRYRLRTDVIFEEHDDKMVLDDQTALQLIDSGRSLYNQIEGLLDSLDTHLILLIEGNTERRCADWNNYIGCNFILNPAGGYRLSYRRALALYNYWSENGFDFKALANRKENRLEVIIAGSGYFGLSRYPDNSPDSFKNRRFTIQVTSKYTLRPAN